MGKKFGLFRVGNKWKMTDGLLKDETLSSKLIKKGFWLYFFSYSAAPAGYFIRIIFSNSLSVEEIGIIYSIVSFVGILSMYNWLGLTESLNYFIPKYWIKKQFSYVKTVIFMSLGVQIITSVVIIFILRFGADWLWLHYFHHEDASQILKYFCFYFLGINIFQVIKSVYISFQDTFHAKLFDFLRIWFVFIFTLVFFLLWKWDILHYSLSWIVGLFLTLIFSFIVFGKNYNDVLSNWNIVYDKDILRKYWKYAFWVFLWANASMLLWQIDQQMIIVLLGPKAAGYYTNYLSLLWLVWVIVGPIVWFLFPLVTELITKKQYNKLWLLQNFIYTFFSIFSLSLWLLLVVLWPELAVMLFGEKFLFSGKLLVFGGGFVVLSTLIAVNFSILTGLDKVKERVKIIAFVWILNIIMNLIFVKFWWLYGIIISTIIWLFLMFSMSFFIVNKNKKVNIQWIFIAKNIIIIVALSIFIYLIKWKLFILNDWNRLTNLFLLSCVGIIYYLCLLILNYKRVKVLKSEILKLKKK